MEQQVGQTEPCNSATRGEEPQRKRVPLGAELLEEEQGLEWITLGEGWQKAQLRAGPEPNEWICHRPEREPVFACLALQQHR